MNPFLRGVIFRLRFAIFPIAGCLLAPTAKGGTVVLLDPMYLVAFRQPPDPGIAPTSNNPLDNFWGDSVNHGETISNPQDVRVTFDATITSLITKSYVEQAQSTYQVLIDPTIDAPLDITDVPVLTSTLGYAQCSGTTGGITTQAAALSSVTVTIGAFLAGRAICGADGQTHLFAVDTDILFRVGVPTTVNVAASGNIGGSSLFGSPVTASFDARADPTFQIDPSFAFASDYRIVLSPGVDLGPTPNATPEPGTYATFACGLAGILLSQTRKKRTC